MLIHWQSYCADFNDSTKYSCYYCHESVSFQISPMDVKCTVNWEQYLTQDIVDDMVKLASYLSIMSDMASSNIEVFAIVMQDSLASFYKVRPEYPNFSALWKDDITFLKKLKVLVHKHYCLSVECVHSTTVIGFTYGCSTQISSRKFR